MNYLNYFTVATTKDGNIWTAGPFETSEQAISYKDTFKAWGNSTKVACVKAANKLDAGNKAAAAWGIEGGAAKIYPQLDCEITY